MSPRDAVDGTIEALKRALEARDLGAIAPLLADRVQWHGDGPGPGCHTREDVLATLAPLLVPGAAPPRIGERARTAGEVLLEVALAGGERRSILVAFDASARITRVLDGESAEVAERDMALRANGRAGGRPATPVSGLVPFVHVADVARSIAFYELLGFEAVETYEPGGRVVWASLRSAGAALMLARAEEPVAPERQAVLFYLYAHDLAALRDHLVAAGAGPGQIVDGSPGPRAELRIDDPDGYCLMVAQIEEDR